MQEGPASRQPKKPLTGLVQAGVRNEDQFGVEGSSKPRVVLAGQGQGTSELAIGDQDMSGLLEIQQELKNYDDKFFVENQKDLMSHRFESLEIKDQVFDQYMKQQLIEDFFESLRDELDDDSVDEMMETLAGFPDEDIYSALSLPYELRARKFDEFAKKIKQGESPANLIKAHLDISKRFGFGVGYHTSPTEIRPTTSGEWIIKGTENDHRDNDINMAYYSTKYRHIYREKNPKYVYIVRTEPSAHKSDGIWSRAGSLSIIAKVPFADVASYVEDTTRKIINDEKGKEEGTAGM